MRIRALIAAGFLTAALPLQAQAAPSVTAIDGLTFRDGAATLRIGRLELPYQRTGDSTISATNITLDIGATHYAIPRIDLTGASLTQADLAALLDTKSRLSAAARVARLSAAHISIPEITIKTILAAQTQSDSYHDVALDNVVNGHAASASVGGLTSTVDSATNGAIQSAYGPTQIKALDLTLAARGISESRHDDAEPLKPLCDSIAIQGGKIIAEQAHIEFGFGTLSAQAVKARALQIPLASAAEVFAMQDKDLRRVRIAAYLADMLDSFEAGAFDVTDLRFAIKAETPIVASLGHLHADNMGHAKIDDVAYENLAARGANWTAKIASLNAKAVDLAAVQDAWSRNDKSAMTGAASPFAAEQLSNEVRVNGVDVDFRDMRDDAPDNSHFHLQIAQLVSTSSGHGSDAPSHFVSSVDHATLDLKPLTSGPLDAVASLGYDTLDVSGRLDTSFDPAKHDLSLSELFVSGAGMGSVKLSGNFAHVNKEFFSGEPAQTAAAALGILTRRIDAHVVNAGLFERIVAAEAKREDVTPERIRARYTRVAANNISAVLGDSRAAKTLTDAIGKFIAAPRNFRVSVVAPDGFGISDFLLLADPQALSEKLSIDAAANE